MSCWIGKGTLWVRSPCCCMHCICFDKCQNGDSSSLASVTSERLFPCNVCIIHWRCKDLTSQSSSPSSMRSDMDHIFETKITAVSEACADTAMSYHVCTHRNSSTLPITCQCHVCMYMLLLFGTTSVVSVEGHTKCTCR